ncbi:MAG: hypothetical protein CVV27_04675 [Candidatus Melainabacteria bacterium HGW-Melainabacteria-1]|nr:MAG: hypothetical protein CVV27_04675 [Candidatus Melainabacteria bacterium HGW-Melainabacteria-1]
MPDFIIITAWCLSRRVNASYADALQWNPEYLQAHQQRAGLLRQMGQIDASRAAYTALLDLSPALEGALTALAELDAPAAVLSYYRAEAFAAQQQHAAAQSAYAESLAQDPDYAPAQLRMAELLLDTGQFSQAYDMIQRHHAQARSARSRWVQGRILMGLGRSEDAEGVLAQAVELDPNALVTREALARLQLELRQAQACIDGFRELTFRRWRHPGWLQTQCHQLQRSGDGLAFRQLLLQTRAQLAGWLAQSANGLENRWNALLQRCDEMLAVIPESAPVDPWTGASGLSFDLQLAEMWLAFSTVLSEQHEHFQDWDKESVVGDWLDPEQDFKAAEAQFLAYHPAYVSLDALSTEAALSLWRHCRSLPVCHDFWSLPGSIQATEAEGILTPLIWQLAGQLASALPGLFKGLQLQAVRLESLYALEPGQPRPLQAAEGQLLAKLWLGPEATQDQLLIYDVTMPAFADSAAFQRLLKDELAKQALLQSRAKQVYTLPGAAGRLVLMQAGLLHRHQASALPATGLLCLNLVFGKTRAGA